MSCSAFSFRSASASLALASASASSFCSRSMRERNSLRHGVELRPPNVVARLRQVGLRLLLLNAVLRPRLADFLLGLFEVRAPVVQRALDGHRIEPDDDIAFLDVHAVLGELEDLEVAATGGGYGQRNRTHRLHFAAHLQVVDELALHDGRGRHIDRRAAAEHAAHAGNGDDDREADDRGDDRAFVIAPHAAAPSFPARDRTRQSLRNRSSRRA